MAALRKSDAYPKIGIGSKAPSKAMPTGGAGERPKPEYGSRQEPVRPKERLLDENFQGKKVLLLQGPVGPFFRQLAAWLGRAGAAVHKINFNGGDVFFYPDGIRYRGTMEAIPEFIQDFCKKHHIDTIMLFGDCRPVHQGIHALACRHGMDLRVFEEGYLRPDYITCERYGVNGYSAMQQSRQFYFNLPVVKSRPEPPPLKKTYWHMAARAFLYYAAAQLLRPLFRKYQHHRPLHMLEAFPWMRSFLRKYFYAFLERGKQRLLATTLCNQYFLVPLQVYNDAQIKVHSKYSSIAEFISEVMESFVAHAPQNTVLAIKQHPMDRGYNDYSNIIQRQAESLGIKNRVLYIHGQHLPTLLATARGVIVVNSTVGLSAIQRGIPVKVCGDTFYDFDKLTFRGTLDDFWVASKSVRVDMDLYARFRTYLRNTSQIYGSFYLSNSIFTG
jgi:capsular polysaccharide export protein